MPASRVKISYSAPVNFLASDQWIQIRTAFDAHLPLRDLRWKSSTDESIRTIHELEVDLIALDSMKDESFSQVPTSLLEKPFLNLYIFPCEDAEQYRTNYKKQVKDWQAIVSNKRHQDWLVILVVRPESKATGSSRIFSMRAPVMDKVKADINTVKKDRCVELTWPVGQEDSAAWTDLIAKIKEGILTTFDAYFTTRQEEIQRSESQRSLPGWNFCTFFILKESLASTFDGMNILEEAFEQYEALEQSFFQALNEKNLPWFGNVGGNAAGDDSRSVLDLTQKAYRELIVSNTVTLFDFRIYLFGCKMHLLAKQHRLLDVIQKSHLFIVSFARTLRENERTLTAFFLESWIYSSAINIIDQCDRWLGKSKHRDDTSYKILMNAKKGDLMNLARAQLDKIGIHRGFLPNKNPFSLSWHSTHPPQSWFASGEDVNSKITRPELIEVLNSQTPFDSLYVSTTQRAIEFYAEGKRRKFALKLHGDLAAFDSHRGNFSTAHQTFTSLPAHYTSNKHKWPPLEGFMIARSLDTHTRLGKEKDEQWLEAALSFLGICSHSTDKAEEVNIKETSTISMSLLDENGAGISEAQRKRYLERLVKDVQTYASGLTEEIIKNDHPSFSIELLNPDTTLAENEDGSFIEIKLRNNLICDIAFDRAEIEIADHDDEPFFFAKDELLCRPGLNTFNLFCPDVHSGIFCVTSVSVWWGKVRLKQVFSSSSDVGKGQGVPQSPAPTPGTGKHPVPTKQVTPIVRIPSDPHSLDIKMALPKTIKWDASPAAQFTLYTGRNAVEDALIKINAAGGVTFQLSEVELQEDPDDFSFSVTDDGILFENLRAGLAIPFSVIHSAPSAGSILVAKVAISYQVQSTPSQPRRSLKVVRRLSTALPIQVSVMDSFRNEILFSKFTISSTSHLQVRIRDTKLEGGTGLKITAPRSSERTPPMIVTPQRSVHFLYQLKSEEPLYERETLYLHITYRTLREEIETRLGNELHKLLQGNPSLVEVARTKMVAALAADASWVEPYLFAGELSIPGLDDLKGELGDAIKVVLARLTARSGTASASAENNKWQKLIIPVDLPFMHIVCTIQTRLVSQDNGAIRTIYAGQPVPLHVQITSSFHWGTVRSPPTFEYQMRYLVQETAADWLVSGHKRGDFISRDNETHSIELTLVPLHHGELPLPSIAVSSISKTTAPGMENASIGLPSTETYHVQAAERVMVLPRGGRSTFIVGMGGED